MTPERRAEIEALLGLPPKPKPKPKVVASEGVVVRDAVVHVSPADPNARGRDEVVTVRRTDHVTINMAAAERQWWLNVRDRQADREQRRALDPFGYGHWGPRD